MRRREFIMRIGGAAVAWPLTAAAQQVEKVFWIGVLPATPTSPALQALREGLKELGYIEGRNLAIEARDGGPMNDRLPALAAELVGLRVDVIVTQALKNNLPGSYPYREWVTAGGLLSYGPNFATTLRGPIPAMIDKILKGAKPSELPVEHAKSEVFINLKTAKAIGLTLPKSLLDRADEVIQ